MAFMSAWRTFLQSCALFDDRSSSYLFLLLNKDFAERHGFKRLFFKNLMASQQDDWQISDVFRDGIRVICLIILLRFVTIV